MRIAMATTPKGGAYTHSVVLSETLLKAGHDLLLFGADKPYGGIPFHKSAYGLWGSINLVVSQATLLESLRSFQPDLFHLHVPSGNGDRMAAEISKKLNIPLVYSYHVVPFMKRTSADLLASVHFSLTRSAMTQAAAIICPTRQIMRQFHRSKGIDPGLLYHIPYGIDTKVFRPRHTEGPANEFRILFVGRTNPEKGIGLLLKAIRLLSRDYHVTIVGTSPFAGLYKWRFRRIPNLVWEGWIDSPHELAVRYSRADLTVLPSTWEEGFGLVVTESMACTTPAVTFDYETIEEIIDDGVDGYVLKERTPRALADFLERVPRGRLPKMGQLAREKIVHKFTTEAMLESTLQVYRNALA